MPAVGKITLDIKDYEKALAQARKSTANFSKSAQAGMQDVSKGVSKAGTVVSAMGSAAGSSLGKLGGMISALASGPVAALTAAIGTMAALAVDLWDKMTLSAEEYAKKLDMVADKAEKNVAQVESQVTEDSGYFARLQELAKYERLSNAEKTEAVTLINTLTGRYGKLGISIDTATGKIEGLDKAQKKLLDQMKMDRLNALHDSADTLEQKAANQAQAAIKKMQGSGRYVMDPVTKLFGGRTASEITADIFSDSRPIADRIKAAQAMIDNSNTGEDIDAWQKVLDTLTTLRERNKQIEMLNRTGSTTEKERAGKQQAQSAQERTKIQEQEKRQAEEQAKLAAQQQAAEQEREKDAAKTAAYYDDAIYALEKQLKIQKAINAEQEYEVWREKAIAELRSKGVAWDEKQLDRMRQLKQEIDDERLRGAQGQQAESLYDRALRAAGRTQEADTRAALANAKKAKGGELTEDEKTRTLELLDLTRQLDENRGASFGNLAVQTNSLTARGGFASGAVVPDSEKYAKTQAENGKSILSVVQRIETICRDFGKF